jgi:hypothetical protein
MLGLPTEKKSAKSATSIDQPYTEISRGLGAMLPRDLDLQVFYDARSFANKKYRGHYF